MSRLARGFYRRDTLTVARELLGCTLVRADADGVTRGRIVEVEAYHGEDDPACHAAAGRTARTDPLYGPPGLAYVYLIYGVHHCLNAVTRAEGRPSAVLVRALEPLDGLGLMRQRRARGRRAAGPRPALADRELTSGPGKLCQAMGITLDDNRADLTADRIWIEAGAPPARVTWTPRIGISVGTERLWRCLDPDSPHVTRSPWNRNGRGEPSPGVTAEGGMTP